MTRAEARIILKAVRPMTEGHTGGGPSPRQSPPQADTGGPNTAYRRLKHFYMGQETIFRAATAKIRGSERDSLFYLRGTAVLFLIFIFGLALFYSDGTSLIARDSVRSSGSNSLFLSATPRFSSALIASVLVDGVSLRAAVPTAFLDGRILASLVLADDIQGSRGGIVEYTVEDGDTASSIAEKFGLSLNTILWANNLTAKSSVKPGQKLVILPVDGMVHHVKDGDTINQIAQTYQAKADDIVLFNGLSGEGDIYIGDVLIVAGGKMPAISSAGAFKSTDVPLASSYFICPLLGSSCSLTQGLHWYNAVDFNGDCGQPILAAAAGKVLKVALTNSTSRWAFGGAGNHMTILHPNGVVSYYGHLAAAIASSGQQVSQGQMIAIVGGRPGSPGAGLSTGCHLHFGVTGGRNPFAR